MTATAIDERVAPISTIKTLEAVKIGDHAYFTADDISDAIGIQRYHIINAVRDGNEGQVGGLHGRKIGTKYLIDADEFNEWVKSGGFEKRSYKKRKRQSVE